MSIVKLTPRAKFIFALVLIVGGIIGLILYNVEFSFHNIGIVMSAVFIINGIRLLTKSIKEVIQLRMASQLWGDKFTKK